MSLVTLSVRNNIVNKGAAYIPDVEEYTGAIIPNPKWVDTEHICLSTGETWFPFRVIKKANIVSSSVAIAYNTPQSNRNVFQAKGNKGNIYTITREGSSWSCTCVGFGFRRDCKHVMASKKWLAKPK